MSRASQRCQDPGLRPNPPLSAALARLPPLRPQRSLSWPGPSTAARGLSRGEAAARGAAASLGKLFAQTWDDHLNV